MGTRRCRRTRRVLAKGLCGHRQTLALHEPQLPPPIRVDGRLRAELGPAYGAQAQESGPGKGLVAKALTQWPDSWSLSAPLQAILLFSAREGGIGHNTSERLSRPFRLSLCSVLIHIVFCCPHNTMRSLRSLAPLTDEKTKARGDTCPCCHPCPSPPEQEFLMAIHHLRYSWGPAPL